MTYRRLASPLHAARAGVGAAWVAALAVAVLVLFHPLALLALTAGVLGAARAAGVGRELWRSLRVALLVAVPIVAINVLVSRDGLTVFARLGDLGPFGQGDLTVEALVYGTVVALKVMLLILLSTLASLAIDPDQLLRAFRRLSFRSALTASLATRMIPLLAADAQRFAEAQRTRAVGAPTGARGRVALVSALVGGSLDRAMDVAATLELRGFAAAGSSPRPPLRTSRTGRISVHGVSRPRSARSRPRSALSRPRSALSRHDLAFIASAVAVLALALVGRTSGELAFQAYPLVQMPADAGAIALCVALALAVLAPFCDRRGVER